MPTTIMRGAASYWLHALLIDFADITVEIVSTLVLITPPSQGAARVSVPPFQKFPVFESSVGVTFRVGVVVVLCYFTFCLVKWNMNV